MKETSEARLAANRANAQKSTGPKTPEGKARSSRNAIKHGLLSKELPSRLMLDGEYKEQLEDLLKDYVLRLQPVDGLEEQLVYNMVMLEWQIRRIRVVEHSLFEMELLAPNLGRPYKVTGDFRIAKAFEVLAGKGTIQLANRVLGRMSRELDRMMKHFLQIREHIPPAATDEDPLEGGLQPARDFRGTCKISQIGRKTASKRLAGE